MKKTIFAMAVAQLPLPRMPTFMAANVTGTNLGDSESRRTFARVSAYPEKGRHNNQEYMKS